MHSLRNANRLPVSARSPQPAVGQPELFSEPSADVLAALQISPDEVRRWQEAGYTCIGLEGDLDYGEQGELRFLRDITRSGLADAQVKALLTQLPRPLRFNNIVAYSFSHGWMEVLPPVEAEQASVEEQLDALADNEAWTELEDLRDYIGDLLVHAKPEGHGTQCDQAGVCDQSQTGDGTGPTRS